jgi:hypothetical protein
MLEELMAYWSQHPPIHHMVAAYLGIGKTGKSGKTTSLVEAATVPGVAVGPPVKKPDWVH